uniref:Uncharacterized protein n=1 Tax=Triticum urartu TaxID=4572 RepID=A0A8R7QHQ7_TRIUA
MCNTSAIICICLLPHGPNNLLLLLKMIAFLLTFVQKIGCSCYRKATQSNTACTEQQGSQRHIQSIIDLF